MCRFYGKAEHAAKAILAAFQSGELPAKLAPLFIHRDDDVPCRAWSWSNQLLTALAGHSDARGFRQWEQVGRKVKKGEKAFAILVPLTKKVKKTDQETGETKEAFATYGFKSAAVFGLSQTEGKPLPGPDPEVTRFLDSLPLVDVARHWELTVDAFNGQAGRALGFYRPKSAIALGVRNLATWGHELVHAADDRLGKLTERGQHWRAETVAELGAAILLECTGHPVEADRGGCFKYIEKYAKDAGLESIAACQKVLGRTCDAVALILETAATLRQPMAAAA